MVATDDTLFVVANISTCAAAHGVISALVAEDAVAEPPGSLGAKGEGGSARGPPQRDKGGNSKIDLGAGLQEKE